MRRIIPIFLLILAPLTPMILRGESIDFSRIQGSLEERNLYDEMFQDLRISMNEYALRDYQDVLNQFNNPINGQQMAVRLIRPFVDFNIEINRNVSPDLFSDRGYIVIDSFTIEVDLHKYLNKLKASNDLKITESQMAYFVGMTFKRKFQFTRSEKDLRTALMGKLEHLFFPFLNENIDSFVHLSQNDSFLRLDQFTFKAAFLKESPIANNLKVKGGISYRDVRYSKTEVHKSDLFSKPGLVLISEKTDMQQAGISLELELFLSRLISLSLFKVESESIKEIKRSTYLFFPQDEVDNLSKNIEIEEALRSLLKFKAFNIKKIAQYITSEEYIESEKKKLKYSMFLSGGVKESGFQKTEIIKDGVKKTFFEHSFLKAQLEDNILGHLFKNILSKFILLKLKNTLTAFESKSIHFEYAHSQDLFSQNGDLDLSLKDENFSLKIDHELFSSFNAGERLSQFNEKVRHHLSHEVVFDQNRMNSLGTVKMSPPYFFKNTTVISKYGLLYFNHLHSNSVFYLMEEICKNRPLKVFVDFSDLFVNCKNDLINKYANYMQDLSHSDVYSQHILACQKKARKYFLFPGKKRAVLRRCMQSISFDENRSFSLIPMHSLKNLLEKIAEKNSSRTVLDQLFQVQNIKSHGRFEYTEYNAKKTDYFNYGNGSYHSSLDQFKNNNGMRAPASLEFEVE